jgi:hypothetical protein
MLADDSGIVFFLTVPLVCALRIVKMMDDPYSRSIAKIANDGGNDELFDKPVYDDCDIYNVDMLIGSTDMQIFVTLRSSFSTATVEADATKT